MQALCPNCGQYHTIVEILDDGNTDRLRDVYQVAPLDLCQQTWLSDGAMLEASARFGLEPTLSDEEDEP